MDLHIARAKRRIRVQSDPRPFVTTGAEGLEPVAARAARRLGARLDRMKGDEVVGGHRERLLQPIMALLTIAVGLPLVARQPDGVLPPAVAESLAPPSLP